MIRSFYIFLLHMAISRIQNKGEINLGLILISKLNLNRIPACQRRRYGTFPGARGREERREPGFPCRQRRCQLYILQRAAACVVVLDIARDAARRRDALRLVLCSVHRHASAHHADAGARRKGGCHRLLRPQLPPKPSR